MIAFRAGFWSIETPSLRIGDLVSSIRTDESLFHSHSSACRVAATDSEILFTYETMQQRLTCRRIEENCISLDCSITNTSSRSIRILSITPVEYCGDWSAMDEFTVSKNARIHSYPAERCYGFDGGHPIESNEPVTSFWFASIEDNDSGKNIFIGIDDVPQGFVRVSLFPLLSHEENKRVIQWKLSIDCSAGFAGLRIEQNETFHAGSIRLFFWEGNHEAGKKHVGKMLGEKFGRKKYRSIPTGWCSWYAGYEANISEEECLKNLSAAEEIGSLTYFQIDDGWMKGRGTRTFGEPEVDGEKFPHGMKWMAEKIRERGLKPGLWIRPFEGWGDEKENPLWARGSCIDLSQDEALEWLRSMARLIVQEWGFEYLKLDFLTYDYYGQWGMKFLDATHARWSPRHDEQTNIQSYRRGLEAIREGAGDDCFLLGCNCHIGPALGLLDGIRIGDDVSAMHWERTVTMGMKSIPVMQFLNEHVWWNDPDCILLHGALTEEQQRLWANAVIDSGGMRMVSSKLYELSPEKRKLLGSLLKK